MVISTMMALCALPKPYAIHPAALSYASKDQFRSMTLSSPHVCTDGPSLCQTGVPWPEAQYFFLKYLLPPASCSGSASSAAVSPRPFRFPERPLSASFICTCRHKDTARSLYPSSGHTTPRCLRDPCEMAFMYALPSTLRTH